MVTKLRKLGPDAWTDHWAVHRSPVPWWDDRRWVVRPGDAAWPRCWRRLCSLRVGRSWNRTTGSHWKQIVWFACYATFNIGHIKVWQSVNILQIYWFTNNYIIRHQKFKFIIKIPTDFSSITWLMQNQRSLKCDTLFTW